MKRRTADGKIRRIRTLDVVAFILVAAACDNFQVTGRQVRAICHIDFAADEGHGLIRAHRRVLDGDGIGIRVVLQIFIIVGERKLLACHKEDSPIGFIGCRFYIFDAIQRDARALYTDIAAGFQAAARDLDRIERIRRYFLITKALECINIDIVVLIVRLFESLEVRIRQFDRTAPESDVLIRGQVGILDAQFCPIGIRYVLWNVLMIVENNILTIQGSDFHVRHDIAFRDFIRRLRQRQVRLIDGGLAAHHMHVVGRSLHIIKVKAICWGHGQADRLFIP